MTTSKTTQARAVIFWHHLFAADNNSLVEAEGPKGKRGDKGHESKRSLVMRARIIVVRRCITLVLTVDRQSQ